MYRFQIRAHTQTGEFIGLVGSTPELGSWDLEKCVRLQTGGGLYPLWWADVEITPPASSQAAIVKIEYKYLCLDAKGNVRWEALGENRWVPAEAADVIVDDGGFGYLQPYPYGFLREPTPDSLLDRSPQGLKIVVIGSSVALGCNAWLRRGWAWQLGQALHNHYGHQLVNVSEIGANVSTTIDRFPLVVTPEQPDIVIIALSLGNEGFAHCLPQQRRILQRRFESGLKQLVKMVRELGAYPILGGVYPHGDYSPDHNWLLRETHQRMLSWDVPVLNWLDAVGDGQGRWQVGVSFDPAHPNTEGHHRMGAAIDLKLFQISREDLAAARQLTQQKQEVPVYRDNKGFHVFIRKEEQSLRVINTTKYPYTITPSWSQLQDSIQANADLKPGIYIAKNAQMGTLPFLSVRSDGLIETTVAIPPGADLEYSAAFDLFAPKVCEILFYDGLLGLLKENDRRLRVINESDHDYNIHPMWQEVRAVLKQMPDGVYEDPLHPDAPFRTMMIGADGLESRVKVPAKSCILFEYQCSLSDISRIAILPLGDRCAVRMLLYKMQYDGPAFPFDLTRTTKLADVADMIKNNFHDMWNPAFLHYSPEAGRIYHTKWSGLSFAHEVEESDDPVHNMFPVYERMRSRYSARSERFWYTIRKADKILFIRTGGSDRGSVMDLVSKLEERCQGKPFWLMIISPQSSQEFAELPNVLHYDLEFNPDRMYEDEGHWMYCTEVMRGILTSLGISSKNLFWCPPNPPKAGWFHLREEN